MSTESHPLTHGLFFFQIENIFYFLKTDQLSEMEAYADHAAQFRVEIGRIIDDIEIRMANPCLGCPVV